MSMKTRVIDGLNFLYDSSPQMSYSDGQKHSRWTAVVDVKFLERFGGGMVPRTVLAQADAVDFKLSDEMHGQSLAWDPDCAKAIKRIGFRDCHVRLKSHGVEQFVELRRVNGRALAITDIALKNFKHLESASLSGLEDHEGFEGCASMLECIIWSTDINRIRGKWLAGCERLKRAEFIECAGMDALLQFVVPSVKFLQIVKPSKDFLLSNVLPAFPNLSALAISRVKRSQIDCEPPASVELFRVNEHILRIDTETASQVDAEIKRFFGAKG